MKQTLIRLFDRIEGLVRPFAEPPPGRPRTRRSPSCVVNSAPSGR